MANLELEMKDYHMQRNSFSIITLLERNTYKKARCNKGYVLTLRRASLVLSKIARFISFSELSQIDFDT